MKLFTECPTPKEEIKNLMESKSSLSFSTKINHLNSFLLLILDLQHINLLLNFHQVCLKIPTMKKMLGDNVSNKLATT